MTPPPLLVYLIFRGALQQPDTSTSGLRRHPKLLKIDGNRCCAGQQGQTVREQLQRHERSTEGVPQGRAGGRRQIPARSTHIFRPMTAL